MSKLTWDRETSEWVAGIGDALHDKLAAVGLAPIRGEPVAITEQVRGVSAYQPSDTDCRQIRHWFQETESCSR